jgi:steroid 5-alpha reductase family enzyme
MTHVILVSLAAALGINAVLFLIAFKLASDKLTDISYAISFLTLDIIALCYAGRLDAYSIVLFLLAAIWSVRIGAFLLMRVLAVGKDRRFDGMRESFIRFGKFWLGQAVTAWVLMLPVTIAQYKGGTIGVLSVLGVAVWAGGLVIEAAADYQKFAFKRSGSDGTWIQSGLWKYARHPNYFGEITVWAGIYIYTFSALDGIERLIGLSSPLLITAVLLFVSGVPILEKNADKRWGKNKEYQDYKARTRLLVPLPLIKR